jgi:hypothetical protein
VMQCVYAARLVSAVLGSSVLEYWGVS